MNPPKHSITWREANKARQRLSNEVGIITKDWGGKLPFAFAYPNSYYIGMSNLGLQAIYGLLNSFSNVVCERVFWDKENRRDGVVPVSVESNRPLTDFAVVAFSLNYELDYFHIAPMLKASGIPVLSEERDETQPLVIAGGPCVTANPAPVAPFFDALFVGEAEALLPPLLPLLDQEIGARRPSLLDELSKFPGVWVPRLFRAGVVTRQYVSNLNEFPVHSIVLTDDTELGEMFLIEVQRGCAHSCRFCLVSNTFSPLRFHSAQSILEQAQEGLRRRPRIGLVGPAVTDHPAVSEILHGLLEMGAMISLSSIRLTSLTESTMGMLSRGGLRSVALAPEAGSACLRDTIKKGIDEDDVLRAVETAARGGITQIKLYFMIGLPGETDDDIQAIVQLALAAKAAAENHSRTVRLSLNVSPFVPKAGTPFQWLPMAPIDVAEKRILKVKNELAARGIPVNHESPQWSEVQAALARGDQSLAAVLIDADRETLAAWRRSAAQHAFDIDFFAHQYWEADEALPWGFIDSGVKLPKLRGELAKALGK